MNNINESPLKSVLLSEDDLGKVVRIHIYIEELINTYVSKAIHSPTHLKKLNLDYSGQVNLALCLGLSEALQKPLNAIGKIRNDFAHRLNQKLDESRVNNFFSTFSPDQKSDLMETIKSTSWGSWGKTSNEEKFTALCIALYYLCKAEITRLEFEIKASSLQKVLAEIQMKENL